MANSSTPGDGKLISLPANSWVYRVAPLPDEVAIRDPREFDRVWNLHPVEFAVVNVFGKKLTPRWQQAFGRDYNFSRVNHQALPITDLYLIRLLEWSNRHANSGALPLTGGVPVKFNSALINFYQDGNHYIGPHSDNEKELVAGAPIYSFSFGQERDFRVTRRPSESIEFEPLSIAMPDNSLIVMGGEMQRHYKHAVPKRALSKCPNRRINITFRQFVEK